MLQFSTQNKIRINLCCNFPHKTKFGSTYAAIFHTKQNSDQPMLQFSTQNKIRVTCPRMWGPVSVETRTYISNRFRHAKTGIPSLKAMTDYGRHWKRLFKKRPIGTRMESSACSTNISPYTWKHMHAPTSKQFQAGLKENTSLTFKRKRILCATTTSFTNNLCLNISISFVSDRFIGKHKFRRPIK